MHELSIALSLMDAASEEAERQGGRVAALHLRLGPLSGVVGDALRAAYDLAREGTDLAAADLLIEEMPLVIFCPACASERRPISVQELRCSICGTVAERVIGGKELELVALELMT